MFLNFIGFNKFVNDWYSYGYYICCIVWCEIKLFVGVGFGLMVIFVKVVNYVVKKLLGFDGVVVIDLEVL